MKYGTFYVLSHLRSQTLLRIYMDEALSNYELRGTVVDVGGGHSPDYFEHFRSAPGARIEKIDGSFSGIDFEKDRLPYESGTVDTVILCNVLEHVYNYRYLLSEIHRILSPGGQLVGFVPFWMWYHPDPHDYFRFTHEALGRIFSEARFSSSEIRALAGGPILGNFNTVISMYPGWLRPVIYLPYAFVASIYTRLRPKSKDRVPLGYVFRCLK